MIPADATSAHVLKFCAEAIGCETPASIHTQPAPGEPERECFITVEKQVARLGGECVIGWAIWELPGIFMDAEFHAVWRMPSGELVDITPRPLPLAQITFARDPHRKYQGLQVDNIRKPLVPDLDVLQLLALHKQRFAVMNAGKRAYQHGKDIVWTRAERAQLLGIADEIAQLEMRVLARMQPRNAY